MPFCKNCGSSVDGQFCPQCGTPAAAPPAGGFAPPPPGPAYQQPAAPPPPAPGYQQASAPPPPPGPAYQQPSAPPPPPGQYYQQPGAPPPAAASAGLTDNVAGALCYFFGLITGILFLVLEPYNRNKTIRFHAFQSIFFNVAMIVLMIVLGIAFGILRVMLPFGMWFLLSLVNLGISLAFLGVWILLMVKAYQNQKFVIPIIGALAEKQA